MLKNVSVKFKNVTKDTRFMFDSIECGCKNCIPTDPQGRVLGRNNFEKTRFNRNLRA